MNLYSTNSFGKDRAQWTKCVITYLCEFFQQCLNEQSSNNGADSLTDDSSSKSCNFYFNWIVFLTELLEKSHTHAQLQSCILICLTALLNYIDFGDQKSWSFINEELLRVVLKYINTPLWSETLDLIRLVVSKSSSLQSKSTISPRVSMNEASNVPMTQVPVLSHSFYSKKELPGRTLDFEFDFGVFMPVQVGLKICIFTIEWSDENNFINF